MSRATSERHQNATRAEIKILQLAIDAIDIEVPAISKERESEELTDRKTSTAQDFRFTWNGGRIGSNRS